MAPSERRTYRRVRHALVVSGALAMPAIAACNSIIGLDDFTEGQCAGGRCPGLPSGEAGTDVDVPETSRPDVVTEGGPGVSRVTWAKWIMPNDDASVTTDNPLAYDAGQGYVRDAITKLEWLNPAAPATYTLEDAREYCKQQGQWRLPSRIELVTLLDLRQPNKIAKEFGQAVAGPYWTSSEVRPFDVKAPAYWVVDFNTGHVQTQSGANMFSVRCVRGGA